MYETSNFSRAYGINFLGSMKNLHLYYWVQGSNQIPDISPGFREKSLEIAMVSKFSL